jgi:hypothetical protein
MNIQTVYKLAVTRADGTFGPWHSPARVSYAIGQTTEAAPDCGPLAAFATLGDALGHLFGCLAEEGIIDLVEGKVAILRCAAVPWVGQFPEGEHGELVAQWCGDRHGATLAELPPATVLCRAITPQGIIPWESIEDSIDPAIYCWRPWERACHVVDSVDPALAFHGLHGDHLFVMRKPASLAMSLPQGARLRRVIHAAMAMARAAAGVVDRAETETHNKSNEP